MVVVIILTVVWVLCEAWFIWSRVKNPLKWQENIFKKNKLYHLVQTSIGLSGVILVLAWIGVMKDRERKQDEELFLADLKEREEHYGKLDQEIRDKFDTIGFYQSQVESFYGMSPHFQVQLSEERGVPSQSRMIACGVNKEGIVEIWQPFNDILQASGSYSECKDSLDYIVCVMQRYNTDYYGRGKLHYSSAENLFVQIFDYKTLLIVDTIHLELPNPESVRVKSGNTYRAVNNIPSILLQKRLYRDFGNNAVNNEVAPDTD